MSNKPLSGITVVDLSRLLPGPFCSLILSDLGARVIKIEDPDEGDYLRNIPPAVDDRGGALFYALNRNKENMVLDLKKKEGGEILKKLVKKGDVLLESFRPGVLARLGFSATALKKINNKLIVASISGFGQKGVNKEKPGHDLNFMSLAGLLNPPCAPPKVQMGDLVGGGLWAAQSIMAAIIQRQKTKKGSHLDISMTDAMTFLGLGSLILSQFGVTDTVLTGLLARYQVYETSDGKFVALAALEDKFWNKFCDLIQKPSWKSQGEYPDFSPEYHHELSEIFLTKTRDQWIKLGQVHDICLTPVLSSDEVLSSEQFRSRGFFVEKKVKTEGERGAGGEGVKKVVYPIVPFVMDGKNNVAFKNPRKRGEDTLKILQELGYSKPRIEDLKKEKII